MQNTLEHINITVTNATRTAALLGQIFNWEIRWQGPALDNGHTIHLGSKETYLALYSHTEKHHVTTTHKTVKHLNHIGVQVSDLDLVENRVKTAGLKPFNHAEYEPGKRFYFYVDDEIEIEVVSYQQ